MYKNEHAFSFNVHEVNTTCFYESIDIIVNDVC